MQRHLDLDDINAELTAAAEAAREVVLPREVAVHPFEGAKLGRAPFTCVDCTIGEARCAYCTTPLKYLYHITSADGRRFIVGSECVKQTGGAVAGFETFNRQMQARVREMQKQARQQRETQKLAEAAQAWQEAHPQEWAYMQARRDKGHGYYSYLCGIVLRFGSIFDSKLEGVRQDMRRDAERAAPAQAPAPVARPVVNLEPVEAAFAKAKAAGIQWPKLRMGGFVFSPAGENSANAGAIYIKTRQPSGDLPGVYMGKVLGGKLFTSRECDKDAEAEILAIAADPKAAAVAYGKKFGKCSVCNRDLTDAASVEAGIGPICAARYGF